MPTAAASKPLVSAAAPPASAPSQQYPQVPQQYGQEYNQPSSLPGLGGAPPLSFTPQQYQQQQPSFQPTPMVRAAPDPMVRAAPDAQLLPPQQRELYSQQYNQPPVVAQLPPPQQLQQPVVAVVGGEATSLLYVDGLPPDILKREVAHIFRPFHGFQVRSEREGRGTPGLSCMLAGYPLLSFPYIACLARLIPPLQSLQLGLRSIRGAWVNASPLIAPPPPLKAREMGISACEGARVRAHLTLPAHDAGRGEGATQKNASKSAE